MNLFSLKTPAWHILSEVIAAQSEAVQENQPFSDVEQKKLYVRYEPEDGQHYTYSEVGLRFVMFEMPKRFDNWGYDRFGGKWDYSFCIIDDFGNAVEGDTFNYCEEGYKEILVPDYSRKDELEEGQPYPYIRMAETVH